MTRTLIFLLNVRGDFLRGFLLSLLIVFSSGAMAESDPFLTCRDLKKSSLFLPLSQKEFQAFLESQLPQSEALGTPVVDKILVSKRKKELYLVQGRTVLKTYAIALGPDPVGAKHFKNDGKTPDGKYFIDYKNSESNYHLSLHVSYPNQQDVAYARSIGLQPGGDIMIHGFPNKPEKKARVQKFHPGNWTDGCMAVSDVEIEEIFYLVREGTAIEICGVSQ